jgi:cytochrome c oxidase subunit 1
VHMPSPSYWPIIVAAGLPIIGYGLLYTYWLCGLGGLMVVGGLFGWGLEPPTDPDAGHHDDHHDDGGAPSEPAMAGAGAEEHA